MAAIRNTNAAIMLTHTVSDFGTTAGNALAAELECLRKPYILKIYPPVGLAPEGRTRYVVREQDVVRGIADLQLRVLPYTADHAYNLFDLPLHHADPFDRQIIAQTLKENIPVITPDETFSLYTGLKILW